MTEKQTEGTPKSKRSVQTQQSRYSEILQDRL